MLKILEMFSSFTKKHQKNTKKHQSVNAQKISMIFSFLILYKFITEAKKKKENLIESHKKIVIPTLLPQSFV